MELQLALTLSSSSVSWKYEGKEMVASNHLFKKQDYNMINCKKRSYDKAFDEVNSTDVPQTLSLFVWKTNGDDDRDESLEKHSIDHFNKNDEDESSIVGWPPIKSWRKRLCHLGSTTNYVTVENAGNRRQYAGRGSNHDSTYVKVKMEGMGIARKVDLSLHHSFETLTDTLIGMFGKCQENVQTYKLAYQDKDGDWLLAGDVPWGTFVRSVQRIKLLKNGDSMLAI